MITVEEVVGQVRRSLCGRATEVELAEDTALQDIGLSSLQVSELLFRLEDDHDFEFDTARAAQVRTLGDIVRLGAGTTAA